MDNTPIRNLVLMLDAATRRQEVLEAAFDRPELQEEWASASRALSRQQQALAHAIVTEPPRTFDDVLAVLVELDGLLLAADLDEQSDYERRNLHETASVAVRNCAVELARTIRPDLEPTESQHDAIARMAGQTERWLPPLPAGVDASERGEG